jgi:hypothetical protein
MIYLKNDNSNDAQNYPVPKRRTDHMTMLANIEGEARKHKASYPAGVMDAVTKLVAKNVSEIRGDVRRNKRQDRRQGDRRK